MREVLAFADSCVDTVMLQLCLDSSNQGPSPAWWTSQAHGNKMTCQQNLAKPRGTGQVMKGEGKMALRGAMNYLGLEGREGSTKYGHCQGQGHAQQSKQHGQRP